MSELKCVPKHSSGSVFARDPAGTREIRKRESGDGAWQSAVSRSVPSYYSHYGPNLPNPLGFTTVFTVGVPAADRMLESGEPETASAPTKHKE